MGSYLKCVKYVGGFFPCLPLYWSKFLFQLHHQHQKKKCVCVLLLQLSNLSKSSQKHWILVEVLMECGERLRCNILHHAILRWISRLQINRLVPFVSSSAPNASIPLQNHVPALVTFTDKSRHCFGLTPLCGLRTSSSPSSHLITSSSSPATSYTGRISISSTSAPIRPKPFWNRHDHGHESSFLYPGQPRIIDSDY